MNMLAGLATSCAMVVLGGCYRDNDPHLPPEPLVFQTDTADAGEDFTTPCSRGCAQLRMLHCAEGNGSPGGVPCFRVCDRARAASFANIRPE